MLPKGVATLLTSITENDSNADGIIDSRYSTTNTYDRKGNQLTSLYENDYDGDGVVDYRRETVYEYLDGIKSVVGVSSEEINPLNNSPDPVSNEELALFGSFDESNFI